jgi:hypothetical protein
VVPIVGEVSFKFSQCWLWRVLPCRIQCQPHRGTYHLFLKMGTLFGLYISSTWFLSDTGETESAIARIGMKIQIVLCYC